MIDLYPKATLAEFLSTTKSPIEMSRKQIIGVAIACFVSFIAVFVILFSPLTNGLFASGNDAADDVISLLVVVVASLALLFSVALTLKTLLSRPIRLDRRHGELLSKGGLFGGWEHRPTVLLAIQFCRGANDAIPGDTGRDKIALQYQVNLVFQDANLTRRNVSQQKYPNRVKRIAREIAKFLDVPVVNYVGPAGSMDAGDAELRRLFAEGCATVRCRSH